MAEPMPRLTLAEMLDAVRRTAIDQQDPDALRQIVKAVTPRDVVTVDVARFNSSI